MVELLSPRQLGYGIRGGAEAAVYSAKTYLESMDHNHLMLKLDFKNALNSLRRDGMLEAILKFFPELFPYVRTQCTPSCLPFFGVAIPFIRLKVCSREILLFPSFSASSSMTSTPG